MAFVDLTSLSVLAGSALEVQRAERSSTINTHEELTASHGSLSSAENLTHMYTPRSYDREPSASFGPQTFVMREFSSASGGNFHSLYQTTPKIASSSLTTPSVVSLKRARPSEWFVLQPASPTIPPSAPLIPSKPAEPPRVQCMSMPQCISMPVTSDNTIRHPRTKTQRVRGPEREFICGHCGRQKTSSSFCGDGRVRIRCECGGQHKDGVPRMHATWIPIGDAPSTQKDPKVSTVRKKSEKKIAPRNKRSKTEQAVAKTIFVDETFTWQKPPKPCVGQRFVDNTRVLTVAQ